MDERDKLIEQLQAKLHCCCGGPVDHAWDGHNPVSMYDHALDLAVARINELEAALKLQEAADKAHVNCDECEGEDTPAACPKCFPLFDDARIARRKALALSSQDRA